MNIFNTIIKQLFAVDEKLDVNEEQDFIPMQSSIVPNKWKRFSFATLRVWVSDLISTALNIYTTLFLQPLQDKTQKFDGNGNVGNDPLSSASAATDAGHLIRKGEVDLVVGQLNDLIDGTIEDVDELKGSGYEDNPKTIEEIIEGVLVPPIYVTPALSNIEIDPFVIEVGEDTSILLSWDLSQNDGGAPDYDSIIFEFAGEEVDKSDYINGTPFFYYENIVGTSPSTELLTFVISYAQGPVKNDLTFGDPYPTGQIPAGNLYGSANLEIKYYSLHGSGVSLPTSANIRSVGSQTGNLTFTNAIQPSDTVSFVFIPDGYELVSIIDTSNLNANLTSAYILQTEDTMPDGGGNDYSGNYYALFFSPYGSVTNHVITINKL